MIRVAAWILAIWFGVEVCILATLWVIWTQENHRRATEVRHLERMWRAS